MTPHFKVIKSDQQILQHEDFQSFNLQINQTVTNFIFYLQFDKRLKVEFDGTKVVNLPEEHCSCTPTSTTTEGPIPPPPPGK